VKAGVSAYIVDGLAPERLKPILEVARARFEAHQAMADELARAQEQLASRKGIERAKGILMSRRGLSEDAAYAELRKVAMQSGRKLADVAESLIAAAELI
jgi:two-component system, response regulator / RNA-binding antiterminator